MISFSVLNTSTSSPIAGVKLQSDSLASVVDKSSLPIITEVAFILIILDILVHFYLRAFNY